MATLDAPKTSLGRYRRLGAAALPLSAKQQKRMASGRLEAKLSEYEKAPDDAVEEGRIRRRLEDIKEARALGITLEEYLRSVE